MGTLVRLVMILGVLVVVFFLLPEGNVPVARGRTQSGLMLGGAAERAMQPLSHVDVQTIERELRETGRVVRHRSTQAARSIAEATEDLRTTAAIEAQYGVDPRLSALAIDVSTSGGVVTLAGHVNSTSDLAHAMDIAMAHDSVRQVISTLQVVRPVADAKQ